MACVCHSLAACQRHTSSSLAAVIGLSNNDVISFLTFLTLHALRWLETTLKSASGTPWVTAGRAVHVEGLATPRTRVHLGHRVGVADGVGTQDVDLIEALIAQPTQYLEPECILRRHRVVHEPTIAHLQR